MRNMGWVRPAIASAILVTAVIAVPEPGRASAATADPAASQQTVDLLTYLSRLPDGPRDAGHTVSGYFVGFSDDGLSTSATEVEQLHQATGQYPGLAECDYAGGWVTDPSGNGKPTTIDPTACNRYLLQWAANGGLTGVGLHAPNPVSGGTYGGRISNFADLADFSTPTGRVWQGELDKVAGGLKALGDAGVPVLFRPLMEMNGNWFWWGSQDKATFARVWKMLALHKPFAFTELGPATTAPMDFFRWRDAFYHHFPETAYFLSWNGKSGIMAPGATNTWSLMNDRWTIDRGAIDVVHPGEPAAATSGEFESATDGWGGWNVKAGPWAVTEWAGRGARSLKADVDLGAPTRPILNRLAAVNLTGLTRLTAIARVAPWGDQKTGMRASVYVVAGPGKTWYKGTPAAVTTDGQTLTLDLTTVTDLNDVSEIGVEFRPAAGANGQSSIYVDDIAAR